MKDVTFWRAYDREECFDVAFSNEMAAYEAAKGNGFYGSDAGVRKETIRIFDSVEDWKGQEDKDKKAAALAKLTDEEKRLLGLSEV